MVLWVVVIICTNTEVNTSTDKSKITYRTCTQWLQYNEQNMQNNGLKQYSAKPIYNVIIAISNILHEMNYRTYLASINYRFLIGYSQYIYYLASGICTCVVIVIIYCYSLDSKYLIYVRTVMVHEPVFVSLLNKG